MSDITEVVGEDVNLTPETSEAEPAPQVETPEVAQEPEQPKVVPLAALHEERQRRRELAEELRQARESQQALERRVEERLAALQKASEPQPPAWEENPAEHLRHQVTQVAQQTQATQQQIQQWQQQQAEQARLHGLAQRIQSAEANFKAENPDYEEAIVFARDRRVAELQALGVDDDQARTQAARELYEAAFTFAQQGKNPAEIVYRVAQAKGYATKPQVTEADKFQAQKSGAAARGLGSGGQAKSNLTAAQLLAMSDDEFAEATKGGKWEKLVG